jgi:hypothetical protein
MRPWRCSNPGPASTVLARVSNWRLAVPVVHDRRQGNGAPLREGECFDKVGGCGVSGFGGAAEGVEGVADGGDPEAVAAWGEGGQGGPGGGGGGQVVGLDGGGDVG